MRLLLLSLVLFSVSNGTPARAEDMPDPRSIAAFATAHADCAEWGDGCFVCHRDASTVGFTCSVPGPTCQPSPLTCISPKP